jgi:hypothetical protein
MYAITSVVCFGLRIKVWHFQVRTGHEDAQSGRRHARGVRDVAEGRGYHEISRRLLLRTDDVARFTGLTRKSMPGRSIALLRGRTDGRCGQRAGNCNGT